MLLSEVASSSMSLSQQPATETTLEMIENSSHNPEVILAGTEFLPKGLFQLSILTLAASSCLLMVIGISLIIHLIRMEKTRIGETRAAPSVLKEVPPTSRIDRSVEAHLQPVRFNCDRDRENSYVEIDDALCEAYNTHTYDETEICKELEAFYDLTVGLDRDTFQKNLNSTLPDLTQGKDEDVSSFIKNCAAN